MNLLKIFNYYIYSLVVVQSMWSEFLCPTKVNLYCFVMRFTTTLTGFRVWLPEKIRVNIIIMIHVMAYIHTCLPLFYPSLLWRFFVFVLLVCVFVFVFLTIPLYFAMINDHADRTEFERKSVHFTASEAGRGMSSPATRENLCWDVALNDLYIC
jgi:hypothetical protein